MYLKFLYDENVGPIEKITINFSFNENGTPKPIVLVGENGSGKSALLSNIVDSLYEIAGAAFSDARQPNDVEGYQYYKAMSPAEIRIGKEYLCSYIEYENTTSSPTKIEYVFKSGNINIESFKKISGIDFGNGIKWDDQEYYKKAIIKKDIAEDIFTHNVLCYFGPDRYEKPNWMGAKYYTLDDIEHLTINNAWSGRLRTPITVKNVTPQTLQWLLDIIVDSRCDLEKNDDPHSEAEYSIAHVRTSDLLKHKASRKNLEIIMGSILGSDIYFGLNFRNASGSRFNIISSSDNAVIVPTLDALSTGQSALFNMFATIVRYADYNNTNNSYRLDEITGIVIIDEIDLHLHTDLQKEVLPKLIALFPKIQFVISTHSPLFLLGMDEQFGENGYIIYQMPEATQITTERFSEFKKAYSYYSETKTHQKEIQDAILAVQEKPLIVTEGSTDWKHLKTAFNHIISDPVLAPIYQNLDFDFLEYEPKKSTESEDQQLESESPKLEMSNSHLTAMCKNQSAIPQMRKLIFLADADHNETNRTLGHESDHYRKWGNNVFSFILPIPSHRTETPAICIEHYYLDEEIKTPVIINDIPRRLYMGNEFDTGGISTDRKFVCYDKNCCGEGKIRIIDGTEEKRVVAIDDPQNTNLALTKQKFAKCVLNNDPALAHFDYKKFTPVFDIIKEILEDN